VRRPLTQEQTRSHYQPGHTQHEAIAEDKADAAPQARADDHRVRRSMAQALEVSGAPMNGENQEIIGILGGDVRRSVRALAWSGPSATGA
jgi:hypothetical protein